MKSVLANRFPVRARLLGLAVLLLASACGRSPTEGQLSVSSAHLDTADGPTSLVVDLDHQLGPTLLEALHSGVPIRYLWTLEFRGENRWSGPLRLDLRRGFLQIDHRSFTRWYTLSGIPGSGRIALPNIAETERALAHLRLPLVEGPGPAQTRSVRFRIELDVGALPPPLRLPAYLSPDWRRDSGWFEWTPEPVELAP